MYSGQCRVASPPMEKRLAQSPRQAQRGQRVRSFGMRGLPAAEKQFSLSPSRLSRKGASWPEVKWKQKNPDREIGASERGEKRATGG